MSKAAVKLHKPPDPTPAVRGILCRPDLRVPEDAFSPLLAGGLPATSLLIRYQAFRAVAPKLSVWLYMS